MARAGLRTGVWPHVGVGGGRRPLDGERGVVRPLAALPLLYPHPRATGPGPFCWTHGLPLARPGPGALAAPARADLLAPGPVDASAGGAVRP